MRKYFIFLLLGFVFCACRSRESDPSSERPASPSSSADCISVEDDLTGSGVGALQIGMSVDELSKRCPAATDTTLTDSEGHPQRVIFVPTRTESIRAEIVDDEVWRITLTEPTWRTSDSLGVGSPLSDLLDLPEVRGWTGEGNLVVVSPRHCGLSFQVDRAGAEPPSGGEWDAAALSRIPDTVSVSLVRIVGCEDFPLWSTLASLFPADVSLPSTPKMSTSHEAPASVLTPDA